MAFDAFISYSHAADGKLAPSLQRGLQQLAKPWSRRQALRIFRDDTGLSVNPALWQSITTALDESEYFILLASPGAAASEWVNQEIEYWMASRPDAAARVLPVLTAGTWVWDNARGDIDWASSTAAPAALAGVFPGEPRHLDLVWAQSQDDLDLRNTRFRDAVADLAAPIHGIPKDELEGEDVRQHRKALRLRRGSVAALVFLVVGLGVAGLLALRSADAARSALRDLEDAGGTIEDLTAEGEALTAANQQAKDDLAATEEARAEADAARASAEEAQATAEAQQAEAEQARTAAEEAQATAEAQQAEAEQARASAEEAQATAEQGQADAEEAAADAADAEAAARLAEATAEAGERVARSAEAEAVAAEAAAVAAEETARAAKEAAVAAEEAARAAEATAVEAAAVAEQLRQDAEAAAQAASLAQAASSQSDPALSALLAVESYCASVPCDAGMQPQSLRAAPVEPHQLSHVAGYDPARLDPLVPMIDAVSRHQDMVRQLPGWSGHAIDVAISGDGRSIAALRDDGRVRVWHPGAPDGVEMAANAIGIAVSDDGTTVAVVKTSTLREGSSGVISSEEIQLIALAGGGGGSAYLVLPHEGLPHESARLSFRPGSNTVVLINFGFGSPMLYDPALQPPGDSTDPLDYTIEGPLATWYGSDRIMFVGAGVAYVTQPRSTVPEMNIANVPSCPPESVCLKLPSTLSSVGETVVIGYSDGSVGVIQHGEFELEQPVDGGRIDDLAVSPGGRDVVTTSQAGPTRRFRFDAADNLRLSADVAVRSRRPIAVATGRGPADAMVVAVDERVEVWTAPLSWAGAFVRNGVIATPTSAGQLLTGGQAPELSSPEGSTSLSGVTFPAVISADGSTIVMGGDRPRVGSVDAIGNARPLDLPLGFVISGPVAVTADGARAAAIVQNDTNGDQRVMTFDGRTGQQLDTFEIRTVFPGSNRSADVDFSGLLVSDEAVVIQRHELDHNTNLLRNDRVEIRLHGSQAPPRIVTLQGHRPMSLTSGPDAKLYIAQPGGAITAYPIAGGDGVDVIDVGPDESVSAIGTEVNGGELIVVGYDSGLVELWNVETGAPVTVLSRHNFGVTNAAIGRSPDGPLRVSTTNETEGVVRTVDDPALLRGVLCAMAGRNLTAAEWSRFVGIGDPQPCARGLS